MQVASVCFGRVPCLMRLMGALFFERPRKATFFSSVFCGGVPFDTYQVGCPRSQRVDHEMFSERVFGEICVNGAVSTIGGTHKRVISFGSWPATFPACTNPNLLGKEPRAEILVSRRTETANPVSVCFARRYFVPQHQRVAFCFG